MGLFSKKPNTSGETFGYTDPIAIQAAQLKSNQQNDKAFKLLVKQKDKSEEVHFLLGESYHYATGVDHDETKAFEEYKLAGGRGYMKLATIDTNSNVDTIKGYFQKCVELNYLPGIKEFANRLISGYFKGGFKDIEEGMKLFDLLEKETKYQEYVEFLRPLLLSDKSVLEAIDGDLANYYLLAELMKDKALNTTFSNPESEDNVHTLIRMTYATSINDGGSAEGAYRAGNYHFKAPLRFYFDSNDIRYTRAVNCYESAAQKNHDKALYNLGLCYEKGYGTTADINKARECYQKAAELGNEKAKEKLASL